MNTKQVIQVLDNALLPDSFTRADYLETTNSWIIRSDHHAFKIRKPLQYSGKDLSDLEKRKEYCYQELNVNRLLATNIYEDVVPVRQIPRAVQKDEKNTIMDYALQMKRLDESEKLLHFLRDKNLDKNTIYKIVDGIVSFHQQAEIIKDTFNITLFQQEFEEIKRCDLFVSDMFGEEYCEAISRSIRASKYFLSEYRFFIQNRTITGYIRDGHGNLSAETIFINNDPVIIERVVTRENRRMDVLFDIARLGVDLDYFKMTVLDDIFLSDYLKKFGDQKTPLNQALYTFYKMYRVNLLITRIVDETTIYDLTENLKEKITRYLDMLIVYADNLLENKTL